MVLCCHNTIGLDVLIIRIDQVNQITQHLHLQNTKVSIGAVENYSITLFQFFSIVELSRLGNGIEFNGEYLCIHKLMFIFFYFLSHFLPLSVSLSLSVSLPLCISLSDYLSRFLPISLFLHIYLSPSCLRQFLSVSLSLFKTD